MNINRNNYESFFLDYIEGNLSDSLKEELLIFIEQNPDLKTELEEFDPTIQLSDEKSVSIDSDLKRILEANLAEDEIAIAYSEDDLTSFQKEQVEIRAKNEEGFSDRLKLYQKMKLKAKNVQFDRGLLLPLVLSEENIEEFVFAYYENDLNPIQKRQVEDFLGAEKLGIALKYCMLVKLRPDDSIIYGRKEDLKRNKTRVVPLYAWVSSAAAIFLLFFVITDYNTDPKTIVTNDLSPQTESVNSSSTEDVLPTENQFVETEIKETLNSLPKEELLNIKEEKLAVQKIDIDKKEGQSQISHSSEHKQEFLNIDEQGNSIAENIKENKPEQSSNNQEFIEDLPFEEAVKANELDDPIASIQTFDVNNKTKESKGKNKTLNIIDVLEKATDNSELISFNSNVNEKGKFNETSFSVGKFSFKRKSRRKNKS